MIAQLHITTALRNGITYLKHSYFTPPLKIANITEDKTVNNLQISIMSSSPGILDGDDYQLKVELDAGCAMQLHTQSYQRLFNMKTGARQLMEVHLKEGATFTYLPHPSVPHENASFVTKSSIYLQAGCSLVWGEVLTCGRKLNGELFQFSKYHSITQVFLQGKLVIKENLLMQPALIDVNAIGQLEGFTHQASLIFLDENADCIPLSDGIYEYLSQQKGIAFGVTAAPINGLIIRILGYKAEQLYDCLKAIGLYQIYQITEKAS
ncbi:urease accessory protein UreD [Parasediminibacterium sp. JCM 36343]|uniref:urease accessory protein UreD n=1 Tax=Parasediminibacterium sp. JCM 36343 TaxID=3374279 RepID=UPI0039799430